jgi:hypothetical protein
MLPRVREFYAIEQLWEAPSGTPRRAASAAPRRAATPRRRAAPRAAAR